MHIRLLLLTVLLFIVSCTTTHEPVKSTAPKASVAQLKEYKDIYAQYKARKAAML